MKKSGKPRRSLPRVDRVLRALEETGLSRSAVSEVVRRELAALRFEKRALGFERVLSNTRYALADLRRAQTEKAINGTGIIVRASPETSAAEPPAVRALVKLSKGELRRRADAIKLAVEAMPMKTAVGKGKSQVSGGALPRSVRASVTLDLLPLNMTLAEFAARLRTGTPAVIGYIADGRFKLDLRTVYPHQDERLFRAIYKAFGV